MSIKNNLWKLFSYKWDSLIPYEHIASWTIKQLAEYFKDKWVFCCLFSINYKHNVF